MLPSPISNLPGHVRARRVERRWSVQDLAKAARISTKTVIRLEEQGPRLGKYLKALTSPRATPRKQGTLEKWLRILARVAAVLGDDSADYFDWLSGQGVPTTGEQRRQAVEAAESPRLGGDSASDTVADFRRHVRTTPPPEPYKVPVRLLTTRPHGFAAENQFYRTLIEERLFRAISPRLDPDFDERSTTFGEMLSGLCESPPRHRLVVGAYELVRRSFQVGFVPIPGFRTRLAALGDQREDFSWEDVERAPKQDHPPTIRPVVIADTVGHYHLQFCNWLEDHLVVEPVYDVARVADAFRRCLDSNPRAVLVAGEYEAAAIFQQLLEKPQGVPVKDLVDLAEQPGVDAPSYRVAMAVSANDEGWKDLLARAMTELFQNVPSLMAEEYARYLLALWKEHAAQEKEIRSTPARAVYDRWLKQGVPSISLRLQPIDLPETELFRRQLAARLVYHLKTEKVSSEGWPETKKGESGPWPAAKVVALIAPWLASYVTSTPAPSRPRRKRT
jgi:hypothetical protein